MRFYKNRSRVVTAIAIAMLITAGWLALKPDHDGASTNTTPAGVSTSQSSTSSTTSIETADFKYEVPAGWVQIKKEALDQTAATSGIAHVAALSATFKTSMDPSTPKDDSSTLSVFKKNAPNFALLSSVDTKIGGNSGRQFTYTFTSTDGKSKIRQQLSVIPYKGKTFFLLFSSVDSDFAQQTSDFSKVLASFKFK